MKRILKSICLLPLLLCINCGVSDSANDTNPTLTVPQDGGAGEAGAGGVGGNAGAENVGGLAGTQSLGGNSTGGLAGTSNVAGAGGQAGRCHHHHYCDLDTHKCN
jgi:hypothetical protein